MLICAPQKVASKSSHVLSRDMLDAFRDSPLVNLTIAGQYWLSNVKLDIVIGHKEFSAAMT